MLFIIIYLLIIDKYFARFNAINMNGGVSVRGKQGATLFLKGVLLLMAAGMIALYVFGLPEMAKTEAAQDPDTA